MDPQSETQFSSQPAPEAKKIVRRGRPKKKPEAETSTPSFTYETPSIEAHEPPTVLSFGGEEPTVYSDTTSTFQVLSSPPQPTVEPETTQTSPKNPPQEKSGPHFSRNNFQKNNLQHKNNFQNQRDHRNKDRDRTRDNREKPEFKENRDSSFSVRKGRDFLPQRPHQQPIRPPIPRIRGNQSNTLYLGSVRQWPLCEHLQSPETIAQFLKTYSTPKPATPPSENLPTEQDTPPNLDSNQIVDDTSIASLQESQDTIPFKDPYLLEKIYNLTLLQLVDKAKSLNITLSGSPQRIVILEKILTHAWENHHPIYISGVLDVREDGTHILVYDKDNYRPTALSTFVPSCLVKQFSIKKGQSVTALAHPPTDYHSCPVALQILSILGESPELNTHRIPFTELTPYYPLKRILLETNNDADWDNLSMRVIDLLTPIGFGQRGLIVAPPRTGKTVLLHAIANAITANHPEAHLIVLLVDERPEEVTDFKRNTQAQVISSTFDEQAENHVQVAESVIENARRMAEAGQHVIILLDSITRLARAYNAMMPSSGKILSGGVEANALQGPKRFFGSARNIEGAGSLTILGTALVETGSRMDEVIFEEFKGTGNMELHLDRALSDKRIFPAINIEKSGTRKEELLYHSDEMSKIYSLRRAMKGVPTNEAMEMLIQRVKKTKSNTEFLIGLSR